MPIMKEKDMAALPMIIVRGIPGSGKSTFARDLISKIYTYENPAVCFETDFFFVDQQTGKYKFDKNVLGVAHNWNMGEVYRYCRDWPNWVCIVANTFTRWDEIKPYWNIAHEFNRNVIIVRMENTFQNVHGVPEETIRRMKDRMEIVPGEYLAFAENKTKIIEKIVNKIKKV